jgi:hypothetical protein
MFRLADIPDYLIMVGVDAAVLYFWWKLMSLLRSYNGAPSPMDLSYGRPITGVAAGSSEFSEPNGAAQFASDGESDGVAELRMQWKTAPMVVKISLWMAVIATVCIMLEGLFLMPYGVARWGWIVP